MSETNHYWLEIQVVNHKPNEIVNKVIKFAKDNNFISDFSGKHIENLDNRLIETGIGFSSPLYMEMSFDTKLDLIEVRSTDPVLDYDSKTVSQSWELFVNISKALISLAEKSVDIAYADFELAITNFMLFSGFPVPNDSSKFLTKEIWLLFLGNSRLKELGLDLDASEIPAWKVEKLENGILILNGPSPGKIRDSPNTCEAVAEYFKKKLQKVKK
jgi:hypothetical protein